MTKGHFLIGTMKWFGDSWGAPINIDCPRVSTPTGKPCVWCHEPIGAGESGIVYSNGPVAHWECFMRQTLGSIAHQQKLCMCFGGNAVEWPGELTRREAAMAAVEFAGLRRPGE